MSPPSGPPHRAALAFALLGCLGVIAAGMVWFHRHPQRPGVSPHPSRAVAIVELQSQTQNENDRWLAPALTEMLGTELSAADDIRVLPGAAVRDASKSLDVQETGGYAREPLTQLRLRLDTDFVISGRYRLADSANDSALVLSLDIQDARTGTSLAVVSARGTLASLNRLVNQAGTQVRLELGASVASRGRLDEIASIQPPTTAVAERIGFSLDAIDRHDSARARDELLEAVAEAPDYAPAYLYLSKAWAALGYRQQALAAAKQAARRSSSAPLELRMQIEATVQADNYDAKHAADIWRSLVALRPSTLDYRLELIGAEIDAGDTDAAAAALLDLGRLPQASQDPRTELAASALASSRNDAQSQVTHAQEALRLAQNRQTLGLEADAQVALAEAQMHLGELESAKGELDESIAGYRQIGNPRGEVAARRLRATVLDSQMRHRDALEEYQRAIALAETIGDAGDEGAVYRNMSSMLWTQGDREGSQASARRALEVGRATGDLRLQIWTLRALATIASDDAATDDVLEQFREVTALTEASHDMGGHVWSLASDADILRLRGQLDEAQTNCVKAQAEANLLSDPQFRIYTDTVCAEVAMDRGEPDTALLLLEQLKVLSSSEATLYRANAEFLTGQIEFDAGRYIEAQAHLRRAMEGYTGVEAHTGEANGEALLALCAQMLKQGAERDRAAAHARGLRISISSRQEIYLVDIAMAKLAAPDQLSTVVEQLRKLADDAERRHFISWSLEAKLAVWQILQSRGNESEAAEARRDLEKAARARGFKRIVALLNSSRPIAQ